MPSSVDVGFRCLIVLAALLASARGQEPKPAAPAARDPDAARLDELLAAHNKARAEEKRPPLRLDARLTEAARGHARDMAEHAKLTHEGSDGSQPKTRLERAGYHYQELGENVAFGQESVGEVMRTWMESPPHKKNILADFTEMGAAVARGSDGQDYWCVDFGKPMPEVDLAKAPGELISALNRARVKAGKKAVQSDPRLARVAARFARESADRKTMATKDRDGKDPFAVLKEEGVSARRLGFSLAAGEGDPAKVVGRWMEDARDREGLMSSFDVAGVGVAADSDAVPYWVILLAQGVNR